MREAVQKLSSSEDVVPPLPIMSSLVYDVCSEGSASTAAVESLSPLPSLVDTPAPTLEDPPAADFDASVPSSGAS